jgi:hypothetical protein
MLRFAFPFWYSSKKTIVNQQMRIVIDGKTSTQKPFQSHELIKRLPIFQVFGNNLSLTVLDTGILDKHTTT